MQYYQDIRSKKTSRSFYPASIDEIRLSLLKLQVKKQSTPKVREISLTNPYENIKKMLQQQNFLYILLIMRLKQMNRRYND